jgi:hypothetical protein
VLRLVKPKIDGESKRDRFIRLATTRTQAVLDKLKILSNCANRQNYDYTTTDAEKILQAIEGEIKTLKHNFTTGNSEKRVFSFDRK